MRPPPSSLRVVLVCAAAAACGKPALVATEGRFDASPRQLDFGRVLVNGQRTAQLTLSNFSKSPQALSLSVAEPFSVAPALELPGAQGAPLDVAFLPRAAGPVEATLHLSSGDEVLEVTLRGTGVEAPVCAPPAAPCREARVDPELIACVEVTAPDGSACSTPCTPGGTCSAGDCLGPAVSCDDHDACTLDLCDAAQGCHHADVGGQCPAPLDPCKAARCDPLTGCAVVDVADGTRCGPADCTESNVCLGGACLRRPTPAGAACGAVSPCQTAGTCQNQVCVAPTKVTMSPVWTYARPAGATLTFPGVSDAAGNLFWFESAGPTLVSVTRDGVSRFAVPLGSLPNAAKGPLALVGGDVLVLVWTTYQGGHGRLEGRSAADGALLWAHALSDLRDVLQVSPANQGFWMMAVAEGRGGDVVANVRSNNGGAAWVSWLAGFDRHSGLLRWSRRYDYLNELVADPAGNVYSYVDLWEHRLLSLDSAGNERWNLLVGSSAMPGAAPPVLALGQTLLTAYPAASRSTATGAVTMSASSGSLFFSTYGGPGPVMSGSWLVASDGNSVCSRSAAAVPPTQWSAPVWSWMSATECLDEAVLTTRGALLISRARTSGQLVLRELDATGAERYACEVGARSSRTPTVLHDGRWFTLDAATGAVMAFDVPGTALAPHGWVGDRGGPARNRRQR